MPFRTQFKVPCCQSAILWGNEEISKPHLDVFFRSAALEHSPSLQLEVPDHAAHESGKLCGLSRGGQSTSLTLIGCPTRSALKMYFNTHAKSRERLSAVVRSLRTWHCGVGSAWFWLHDQRFPREVRFEDTQASLTLLSESLENPLSATAFSPLVTAADSLRCFGRFFPGAHTSDRRHNTRHPGHLSSTISTSSNLASSFSAASPGPPKFHHRVSQAHGHPHYCSSTTLAIHPPPISVAPSPPTRSALKQR